MADVSKTGQHAAKPNPLETTLQVHNLNLPHNYQKATSCRQIFSIYIQPPIYGVEAWPNLQQQGINYTFSNHPTLIRCQNLVPHQGGTLLHLDLPQIHSSSVVPPPLSFPVVVVSAGFRRFTSPADCPHNPQRETKLSGERQRGDYVTSFDPWLLHQ